MTTSSSPAQRAGVAKVFYFRHQAAGILHAFPFAQPPSEQQIAALTKRCFQVHGFGHPKTPTEPYWVRVEEHDALGPEDVITVPEMSLSVASAAGSDKFTVSGAGEVTSAGV